MKIIDADIIARQLVEPEQPALLRLTENFGQQILDVNGHLNRAVLREIVFADSEKKLQLENIMHPLIYNQIKVEMECLQQPYCILDIPLLLETGDPGFVDRVLVIDCDPDLQLKRVMTRDRLNQERANSIIASQMSRTERLKRADDIIDNSGNTLQLAEQIKKLHNSYILLATVRTSSA